MPRKSTSNGGLSQEGHFPAMTAAQEEVYRLLHHKTPRQITEQRGTKKQATYKILRKLQEKGWVTRELLPITHPDALLGGAVNFRRPIRRHGEEYHVKILCKDRSYELLRRKSNFLIKHKMNTIRLHPNTIEIYIMQGFWDYTLDGVRTQAYEYIIRLLYSLENFLKITLVKDGYTNIRLVKVHIAEVGNELAHQAEAEKKRLKVVGKDGKVWLIADNSEVAPELEFIHPERAEEDASNFIRRFNDVRDNPWLPLQSEQYAILQHHKTQIENLGKTVNSLMKKYERIREKLSQKSLSNWL